MHASTNGDNPAEAPTTNGRPDIRNGTHPSSPHVNPPPTNHIPQTPYSGLNLSMSQMGLYASSPIPSPYTPHSALTPSPGSTGIVTPLTAHAHHQNQGGYGGQPFGGMHGYTMNGGGMGTTITPGSGRGSGGPAGHAGMMGFAPPYGYMMGGNGSPRPGGPGGGMRSPPMGMNKMLSPRLGTLPDGSMDPAQMTGNYGPAAAAAAAAAAGNTTGRTVYVGTLPPEASVDELMNLVRFGPVESVRVLPEKSCVFISFLDGATAAAFHADATVKKLTLHGQELKIGWGKPSVVPGAVIHGIAMSKATRNVYLGGLDESHTESTLRDDLSRFGPIDQVKVVKDKGIGFVHFLSILAAMRVVATLSTESEWKEKRIGYGKDRCAYVPRAQQAAVQAAQAQAAAAIGRNIGMPGAPFQAFNPQSPVALYGATFSPPMFAQNGFGNGAHRGPRPPTVVGPVWNGPQMQPNRCVYLGNIPEGATTEEVCNIVKGGLLQHVKYIPEKHIAFITFVRPDAANAFHHLASTVGISITEIKLRVGWGKTAHPIPTVLMRQIEEESATRNIYLGNILEPEVFTLDKLRNDFGPFGEIEHINFVPEKKIGFVNFCSITNAVRALEAMKANADYGDINLAYGKDRCANMPVPRHSETPNGRGVRQPSATTSKRVAKAPVNSNIDTKIPGADKSDTELGRKDASAALTGPSATETGEGSATA